MLHLNSKIKFYLY